MAAARAADNILYNTINRIVEGTVMSTISANDLKTKGIGAIEQALIEQSEASVSVRGQVKYVVMSQAQYQYLRECELEAALAESMADMDAGRFVAESVAEHLNRIARMNQPA